MLSPNIGQAYGERVAQIYADAELRIIAQLTAAIAKGIGEPTWELDALARIQEVREQAVRELARINPQAAAQLSAILGEAYTAGGFSALTDIGKDANPLDLLTEPERRSVAAIATEMTSAISSTTPGILRAVDDVYRNVVADAVASASAGGEFRKEAAQRALDDLVGRGLRGIETGRGTMNLPDYVTMAVRTGTAKAAFQGHIDTQLSEGFDLVTIKPGPRACDICDKWARLVLALTGSAGTRYVDSLAGPAPIKIKISATLDEARSAGWGHPNCRCALATYLPGLTRHSELQRDPWDEAGYQAQQQQRAIERRIRDLKYTQAAALDPATKANAAQAIKAAQAQMRQHLAEHPELKRQSGREQIGRVI